MLAELLHGECIFVSKKYIKTRPDSLTNQRLPGINTTKIAHFLVTTKQTNDFYGIFRI